MVKNTYSFENWCIDNNRCDLLERWDNEILPSSVSFKSNSKYYFKCPNGLHESQSYCLYDITGGKNKTVKCKKCNSFAQYIIDKYDEDYLEIIWSIKNDKSPWNFMTHSNKKVWFNCENNNKHIYSITLNQYSNGVRCPYCSNQKIIYENSLGVSNPEVTDIWSDKNEKTPYDYAPHSGIKVWWKCENGIHEDFERKISNSSVQNFKCPKCKRYESRLNRKEDLSGQKFGELTALYIDKKKTYSTQRTHWVCKCSCGKITSVCLQNLKNKTTNTCGDMKLHYSGEKSPNWKGGITSTLLLERTSTTYNHWRDEVYKKDWYTCQCCGESKNINKNAHHLYNFSSNESLRYDVTNGILLCNKCHAATIKGGFHNIYGTTNNTPKQLEEYINNKRNELGIDIAFTIQSYIDGNILKPNDIKVRKEF